MSVGRITVGLFIKMESNISIRLNVYTHVLQEKMDDELEKARKRENLYEIFKFMMYPFFKIKREEEKHE